MIFTVSAVRSVSRNSLLTLAVGIVCGFSFAYMILNVNVNNGYASTEMFLQQPSSEQVLLYSGLSLQLTNVKFGESL